MKECYNYEEIVSTSSPPPPRGSQGEGDGDGRGLTVSRKKGQKPYAINVNQWKILDTNVKVLISLVRTFLCLVLMAY